jgi:hypothetical protein
MKSTFMSEVGSGSDSSQGNPGTLRHVTCLTSYVHNDTMSFNRSCYYGDGIKSLTNFCLRRVQTDLPSLYELYYILCPEAFIHANAIVC